MNLYNKIDDGIMKGVNAGVKAWNWTTGRTKSDLANSIAIAGAIVTDSAVFTASPLYKSIPMILFSIPPTCVLCYNNKKLEEREIKALNKSCLDSKAENLKLLMGIPAAGFTFYGAPSFFSNSDPKEKGLDLSILLYGLSFYASRADYLPPRKNCLNRGLDKAKEWYQEFSKRPTFVPLPSPFGRSYQSLEEQLT